jgi:asparaginyl-tRNA synthetase
MGVFACLHLFALKTLPGMKGKKSPFRAGCSSRPAGKLQFLRLRDGTGVIQAVLFQGNVDLDTFEAAKRMPLESSLIVSGTLRADSRAPGIPGGYELDVQTLQVVQEAAEYPIGPKEHGVEFLMDNRHLWIRSNRQWAILRTRATIVKAMRDWLDNNGFVLVDTPFLTPAAVGARQPYSKPITTGPCFPGPDRASSHNEANIFTLERSIALDQPSELRRARRGRRLQEFWMVEPDRFL